MHQKYATDLGHCVCSIILKTTFVKKLFTTDYWLLNEQYL